MKKIIIITVSIILTMIIIILVIQKVNINSNTDKLNQAVDVYYVNSNTKVLDSEKRFLQTTTRTEQVAEVLNYLTILSPTTKSLRLPSSTEINVVGSTVVGDTAYVYFDETFNNLTNVDKIYLKSAITWSLTSIDDISHVIFHVGDQILKTGTTLTPTYPDNYRSDRSYVYLNPTVDPQNSTFIGFKLYFINQSTNLLEAEQRLNVYANPNVIREYYIVDELIKGTTNANFVSYVPKTTKIINIETDNRICYVNLSEDFITKQVDDELLNYLAVYQIVNSLTVLEDVDAVQIFIDSKRVKGFNNGIDLRELLNTDTSIVFEEPTDVDPVSEEELFNYNETDYSIEEE